MYGFFEPGGGVDKYFNFTKTEDVLLRTTSTTNNIVLGNASNATAAVYINNNRVGIRKIPNTNFSLDVSQTARFDKINVNNTFTIDSNAIHMENDCKFYYNGLVENKLIITDSIKKFKTNIEGVVIEDLQTVSTNVYRLYLTLPTTVYTNPFAEDNFIRVNGIVFKIVDSISDGVIDIEHSIATERNIVPFATNDTITIAVFEDFYQDPIETSNVWLKLTGAFYAIHASKIVFRVTIMDDVSLGNLVVGNFFSFGVYGAPENLLELIEIVTVSESNKVFDITLATPGGRTFPAALSDILEDMMDYPIELILKDTLIMQKRTDQNVTWGTIALITDTYVQLKDTTLTNLFNGFADPEYNILRSLTFTGITYDVITIRSHVDNSTVMMLRNYDTSYAFTIKGTLTYTMVGAPLYVTSQEMIAMGEYRYNLYDSLEVLHEIERYVGHIAFITTSNIYAKILSVNLIDKFIVFDKFISIADNNFFYCIPFKEQRRRILSKENCYIGEKLGIGTKLPVEKLTVEGNVSVKNKLVYLNIEGTGSYQTRYTNNTFFIGDNDVEIDSNIRIKKDTEVNGTVLATQYLNYSDMRLKRNIRESSTSKDIEILKNLSVYDYVMNKDARQQKGVLAHELQKLAPEMVKTLPGVISSVCQDCHISGKGSIIIRNVKNPTDFKCGTKLRINKGVNQIDVEILNVQQKKNTLFLKVDNHFNTNTVYVEGPHGNIKVIDQDSITWVLLNGMKVVLKDLEQLKQDVKEFARTE